jgi:hypothetical protein
MIMAEAFDFQPHGFILPLHFYDCGTEAGRPVVNHDDLAV